MEQPRGNASEFIGDGHGNVASWALAETRGGRINTGCYYSYRMPDGREWKKRGELVADGGGGYAGTIPMPSIARPISS